MVQCGPLTQCHYLFREGGLLQLNVCLGIGQDGLQRLAQELLIKVLVLPHQRTEGHRHLHLHARKVLTGKKMTDMSENLATGPNRFSTQRSPASVLQRRFKVWSGLISIPFFPFWISECARTRMKSTWDQYLQASGHTSEKKRKKKCCRRRLEVYCMNYSLSQHLDSKVWHLWYTDCGILSNVTSCQRVSIPRQQLMWAWSA